MDANILTKKIGPLPGSVWLLGTFALGYIVISSKKRKTAAGAPGRGDVSYISGEGNTVQYSTSSVVNSYIGPGAGGEFTGSYNAPVTTNTHTGDLVQPPDPPTVIQFPRPSHRHSHHRHRGGHHYHGHRSRHGW